MNAADATHIVTNQPPPLAGYNAWTGDRVLIAAAKRVLDILGSLALLGFLLGGVLSATNLYVGAKTGWKKEEFLGHCAEDKAGIGWNGWKNAEIYTYTAIIFSENESN